jgi:hypothetical protein
LTEKTTYALLIYRTSAGEPAPESSQRALAGHLLLQREVADRGDLHAVAKLDGVQTARTVRVKLDAHEITDGPYIESKEWLVGFYLLDCESFEHALDHAKMICPVRDHAIEVRPVGWTFNQ